MAARAPIAVFKTFRKLGWRRAASVERPGHAFNYLPRHCSAAKSCSNGAMTLAPDHYTQTLRQARKARRLSQLELSLRLDVSQRHLSFVESGRARPSRALLLAWLHELALPLAARNHTLLLAGYAPAYPNAGPDDAAIAVAHQALTRLLAAHDPMPALMLDAHWNLHALNRGSRWLAGVLAPAVAGQLGAGTVNLLDLLLHPDGLAQAITNLDEVGPLLLAQLRDEAAALPALASRVSALGSLLQARLGSSALHGLPPPRSPVLTTRYATAFGELAFFSMFTTFGTPQDITLASLRVEHLFAADAHTQAVVEQQVAASG